MASFWVSAVVSSIFRETEVQLLIAFDKNVELERHLAACTAEEFEKTLVAAMTLEGFNALDVATSLAEMSVLVVAAIAGLFTAQNAE